MLHRCAGPRQSLSFQPCGRTFPRRSAYCVAGGNLLAPSSLRRGLPWYQLFATHAEPQRRYRPECLRHWKILHISTRFFIATHGIPLSLTSRPSWLSSGVDCETRARFTFSPRGRKSGHPLPPTSPRLLARPWLSVRYRQGANSYSSICSS